MAQKSVNNHVIPKFYNIKEGTSSDKYFNDDEKVKTTIKPNKKISVF